MYYAVAAKEKEQPMWQQRVSSNLLVNYRMSDTIRPMQYNRKYRVSLNKTLPSLLFTVWMIICFIVRSEM